MSRRAFLAIALFAGLAVVVVVVFWTIGLSKGLSIASSNRTSKGEDRPLATRGVGVTQSRRSAAPESTAVVGDAVLRLQLTVIEEDGSPIPQAQSLLRDEVGRLRASSETDESGCCELSVEDHNSSRLEVSRWGYETVIRKLNRTDSLSALSEKVILRRAPGFTENEERFGVIRGLVKLDSDEEAAGLEIWLLGGEITPAPGMAMETFVSRRIGVCTTDSTGSFVFRKVPSGQTMSILTPADEWTTSSKWPRLVLEPSEVRSTELPLVRAASVVVSIKDAEAKHFPEARVELNQREPTRRPIRFLMTQHGTTRFTQLMGGSYSIDARFPPGSSTRQDPGSTEVSVSSLAGHCECVIESGESKCVVVSMVEDDEILASTRDYGESIRCEVVDEVGERVTQDRLRGEGIGVSVDAFVLDKNGTICGRSKVRPDGRFGMTIERRFQDDSSSLCVRASSLHGSTQLRSEADGIVRVVLPLLHGSRELGGLSGVVVSSDPRTPVVRAVIDVRSVNNSTPEYSCARADEHGVFKLGGLRPGTYRVRAMSVGFADRYELVEVVAASWNDVRLVASPAVILSGRLMGLSEDMRGKVSVLVSRNDVGSEAIPAKAVLEESGQYSFAGLEIGVEYTVVVNWQTDDGVKAVGSGSAIAVTSAPIHVNIECHDSIHPVSILATRGGSCADEVCIQIWNVDTKLMKLWSSMPRGQSSLRMTVECEPGKYRCESWSIESVTGSPQFLGAARSESMEFAIGENDHVESPQELRVLLR